MASPAVASSLPTEFEFPARARSLARRVASEVIDPARQLLLAKDRDQAEAIATAGRTLSACRDRHAKMVSESALECGIAAADLALAECRTVRDRAVQSAGQELERDRTAASDRLRPLVSLRNEIVASANEQTVLYKLWHFAIIPGLAILPATASVPMAKRAPAVPSSAWPDDPDECIALIEKDAPDRRATEAKARWCRVVSRTVAGHHFAIALLVAVLFFSVLGAIHGAITSPLSPYTWLSLLAPGLSVLFVVYYVRIELRLRGQQGRAWARCEAAGDALNARLASQMNARHLERCEAAHRALRLGEQTHFRTVDQLRRDHHRRCEEANSALRVDQSTHDESVSFATQAHAAALLEVKGRLLASTTNLKTEIHDFAVVTGFANMEWGDPGWYNWKSPASQGFAARFGTLSLVYQGFRDRFPDCSLGFAIPALVPFSDHKCLLFKASAESIDVAKMAMQSVMVRMLATAPAGKLRFTFIDPVGLGQSVASFLALGDHDGGLIAGKPWTESHHIERCLVELSEHIETVIQKYLRNDHSTIHEYNKHAGEVAEAFRTLVVFDFPAAFSEDAARRLLSIVQNGPRCGVFTMIVMDRNRELPYRFPMANLDNAATMIEWREGDEWPIWNDPDFKDWQLRTDRPPEQSLSGQIVDHVGEKAKTATKVEIPFDKLLTTVKLDEDTWWSWSTLKGIRVPLGPAGARKSQFLTLGEGVAHHALVVGRTGSGKTNLMHVIIAALALAYSPDEIQLYLIDFKGGVGFKPYANHRLPHAKVIAIETDREFGISVLYGLDAELKRRSELFRTAGVDNIAAYRTKTSSVLPRIFMLVDEFHEFFAANDRITDDARLIMDRLVRQGRAFGIHLMLASQSLTSANMSGIRSMIDQMAVRIALQCSATDAQAIMSTDNQAAKSLSRPGEAIYNDASGAVEANSPFQAAMLGDNDLTRCLEEIERVARSRQVADAPIVFEGNEPARLAESLSLLECLAAPAVPLRVPTLWLGEPIALHPTVSVALSRKSGRNLLVLSREENEGVGLLTAALLSLLIQSAESQAKIYFYNHLEPGTSAAVAVETMCRCFGTARIEVMDRRAMHTLLGQLAREIQTRMNGAIGQGEAIYLAIGGLHRARDLRPEDEYAYKSPAAGKEQSAPELLSLILKDGAEFGIHVLAWCDTYPNAKRVLNRSLGEFGVRVSGAMSADESRAFLDTPDASRLEKPHRVLLSDDMRPGHLAKFRPYGVPETSWIENAAASMLRRS